MMKKCRLLIFATGFLLVTACKQDKAARTASGFEYVMHEDVSGPTPEIGEFAFFNVYFSAEDTIVHSSDANVQIEETNERYGTFTPIVELLKMMSVGDSATLYYPVDSFPNPPPGYENVENVEYDIALFEIKTPEQYQVFQEEEQRKQKEAIAAMKEREMEVKEFVANIYGDYKSGKLDNEIISTTTGLKYIVHETGAVGKKASAGQGIEAHYYGILGSDGSMFDNSWRSGRTFTFPLGRRGVIAGWDEGFALLNEGAKATFFIPPALGYGKGGSPPLIPGDADLIFYVEFVSIK
jgi:FKBP-type peptidyl-prolyl cis-trans isomerase FkpA